MKSEHRGLLAIALSAAIFFIWYTFISPPKPPQQPSQEVAQVEKQTAEQKAPVQNEIVKMEKAKEIDTESQIPIKTADLENDLVNVTFTNVNAIPTSWQLKKYMQQADKETVPINLVYSDINTAPALKLSFVGANFEFPLTPRYELVSSSDTEIQYKWQSKEVEILKTIKLSKDGYTADLTVEVINKGEKTINEKPFLSWGGTSLPSKKTGFFSFLKQPPATNKSPIFYINNSAKRIENVAKITSDVEQKGALSWAGLEDRYFLTAIIPRGVSSETAVKYGAEALPDVKGGKALFSGIVLDSASIPPGQKTTHNFSIYAGPKDINQLKAVGVHLEKAINYGWFSVIAVPILYLLKFFHQLVKNYGIAIILLTVFIKMLLHPINIKSLKSMKQMQAIQPKLKELQQKFKNDKEKLNVETMQLFRSHKINPMGGCLPMLLQFPIYIALYKVLWSSIELYRAPFFWFYKDLSAPDPYLITPILLGIGMMLQQKFTPASSADPAQQKMMMFMPIMFSAFMLFLPVGLVIYILVNTVMSVTQQWMYNKNIGLLDLIKVAVRK